MISGAYISSCKKYRYSLWRSWAVGKTKPKDVCFIMLNPSTADDAKDDPTIRRCVALAKSWGYNGLMVVNLFALRATDPKKLKTARDPIGPENDTVIVTSARSAKLVVCAWGNHGTLHNRDQDVLAILQNNEIAAYALKVTEKAQPWHPLYVKGSVQPKILMSHSKETRRKSI